MKYLTGITLGLMTFVVCMMWVSAHEPYQYAVNIGVTIFALVLWYIAFKEGF